VRPVATILPWAAALSFGAFVGVLPFGSNFARAFPAAIGVCLVIGVPIALFRRGYGEFLKPFAVILGLAGLVVMTAVLGDLRGLQGEAGGWILAITIFYVLPIALACAAAFAVLAGSTVLGVLYFSGEISASREGMSILDLPYPRLRAALLLLLAIAPPALRLSRVS